MISLEQSIRGVIIPLIICVPYVAALVWCLVIVITHRRGAPYKPLFNNVPGELNKDVVIQELLVQRRDLLWALSGVDADSSLKSMSHSKDVIDSIEGQVVLIDNKISDWIQDDEYNITMIKVEKDTPPLKVDKNREGGVKSVKESGP